MRLRQTVHHSQVLESGRKHFVCRFLVPKIQNQAAALVQRAHKTLSRICSKQRLFNKKRIKAVRCQNCPNATQACEENFWQAVELNHAAGKTEKTAADHEPLCAESICTVEASDHVHSRTSS